MPFQFPTRHHIWQSAFRVGFEGARSFEISKLLILLLMFSQLPYHKRTSFEGASGAGSPGRNHEIIRNDVLTKRQIIKVDIHFICKFPDLYQVKESTQTFQKKNILT